MLGELVAEDVGVRRDLDELEGPLARDDRGGLLPAARVEDGDSDGRVDGGRAHRRIPKLCVR